MHGSRQSRKSEENRCLFCVVCRVYADVIAAASSTSMSQGLRGWCSPTTPSSGLACELQTVETGENHPPSRLSTTVGAAQRRDASQPASQPGVHCAPPFGASPGRAEPSVSSQSGGESVRGENSTSSSQTFSFSVSVSWYRYLRVASVICGVVND